MAVIMLMASSNKVMGRFKAPTVDWLDRYCCDGLRLRRSISDLEMIGHAKQDCAYQIGVGSGSINILSTVGSC
jgi:hypothetical protein